MARALEVGSAVAFGDLPYGLRPSAHSQEGCCQEGPCEEGRGEEGRGEKARGEEVLLQEGLREEGSGQEARRQEAREEGGEEVKPSNDLLQKARGSSPRLLIFTRVPKMRQRVVLSHWVVKIDYLFLPRKRRMWRNRLIKSR